MICDRLSDLLGFECCPLTAAGDVALIETPFQFADGEGLPVYSEVSNGLVRFFDDGGVVLHFLSRGLRFENKRHVRFIATAAEANGAVFTELGEVEAWGKVEEAPLVFARYLSTLLQLVAWESTHQGVDQDTGELVEEVVLALKAWKPDAAFISDPSPVEGISGQHHTLDAMFDGKGVIVTGTHHSSVNSNLHKLVDLRARPANLQLELLVVIDDRADAAAATREAKVMQAVATVLPFTQLEKNARMSPRPLH